MRLATGAGLLLSAHSIARWRVRRGEVITRGGVKQVWSSRGEGWDVTPRLCAKKISTDEGGLSQSPPFFLCRAVRAAMALRSLGSLSIRYPAYGFPLLLTGDSQR
jgi:hypothetical protein